MSMWSFSLILSTNMFWYLLCARVMGTQHAEPALLPTRQVRETDTHRETITVKHVTLDSAERFQKEKMHSEALEAWREQPGVLLRGPGEDSKSDIQTPMRTVFQAGETASAKVLRSTAFFQSFLYVCNLVLSEMEITIMRPFACVQPAEFNRFPLAQHYKLPH